MTEMFQVAMFSLVTSSSSLMFYFVLNHCWQGHLSIHGERMNKSSKVECLGPTHIWKPIYSNRTGCTQRWWRSWIHEQVNFGSLPVKNIFSLRNIIRIQYNSQHFAALKQFMNTKLCSKLHNLKRFNSTSFEVFMNKN